MNLTYNTLYTCVCLYIYIDTIFILLGIEMVHLYGIYLLTIVNCHSKLLVSSTETSVSAQILGASDGSLVHLPTGTLVKNHISRTSSQAWSVPWSYSMQTISNIMSIHHFMASFPKPGPMVEHHISWSNFQHLFPMFMGFP